MPDVRNTMPHVLRRSGCRCSRGVDGQHWRMEVLQRIRAAQTKHRQWTTQWDKCARWCGNCGPTPSGWWSWRRGVVWNPAQSIEGWPSCDRRSRSPISGAFWWGNAQRSREHSWMRQYGPPCWLSRYSRVCD